MATRRQSTQRKKRFLAAFANAPTISAACRESGVPRPTVYEWLERDDAFARHYRELETAVRESAIDEAYRRGVKGYDEPVFDLKTGKQVGTIRKYSDAMLSLLLRGWHPATFRDPIPEQQQVTIKVYQGVDVSRVIQPPAGDAGELVAGNAGAGAGSRDAAVEGVSRLSPALPPPYAPAPAVGPLGAAVGPVPTDGCLNIDYRNHQAGTVEIAGETPSSVLEGQVIVPPDSTDEAE